MREPPVDDAHAQCVFHNKSLMVSSVLYFPGSAPAGETCGWGRAQCDS